MNERGLLDARAEVAWFFASASAAMGLHAQAFEGGGGGVVWDEARCDRLHDGRLSVQHRQTVTRYGRVLTTMRQVGVEVLRDLRLVYVPFGAARVSWQAYCCFTHEDRQLLGLVLVMDELRVAFRRKHPKRPLDSGRLLQFVADEVSHIDQTLCRPGHALPIGHVLEPALRAATAREIRAIETYDKLRAERVRGENAAREQYYDELRNRI